MIRFGFGSNIDGLLRKITRDHERFRPHFDALETTAVDPHVWRRLLR
jgi:hypothetical protein